jgi:hypothetical protein
MNTVTIYQRINEILSGVKTGVLSPDKAMEEFNQLQEIADCYSLGITISIAAIDLRMLSEPTFQSSAAQQWITSDKIITRTGGNGRFQIYTEVDRRTMNTVTIYQRINEILSCIWTV